MKNATAVKDTTKAKVKAKVKKPKGKESTKENTTSFPEKKESTNEKVEKVEKVQQPKRTSKDSGPIRHVRSLSRNGKEQNRLKGTAERFNKWGHKVGSQAAKIDHLIDAGRFSMVEIFTMSGAGTKGRIYNHIASLKRKGFIVETVKGKMKFSEKKVA